MTFKDVLLIGFLLVLLGGFYFWALPWALAYILGIFGVAVTYLQSLVIVAVASYFFSLPTK